MIKELEQMPDHARLWVYQCDRKLSDDEKELVKQATKNFLGNWAAHGQELLSSFDVLYNQFLIIAVDESMHGASGCSIDASVSLIRELEKSLNLSMLDRSKIAFLAEEAVLLKPLHSLKEAVHEGSITEDMKVFNNSVSNYGDWKNQWVQPAKESWMSRYF